MAVQFRPRQPVKGPVERRARRRLRALRRERPKALPGVRKGGITGREARRIKRNGSERAGSYEDALAILPEHARDDPKAAIKLVEEVRGREEPARLRGLTT